MKILIRDIGDFPEMNPRYGWAFWWDNNDDEDRYERLSRGDGSQGFDTIEDAKTDAEKFKALVSDCEILIEE